MNIHKSAPNVRFVLVLVYKLRECECCVLVPYPMGSQSAREPTQMECVLTMAF